MAILHIVMGCAGAGKSTFVMNHLDENSVWISRDSIRFSLVSENEEYFSKERQVFDEFVKAINDALVDGKNVFADATHLNRISRNKLITSINPKLKIDMDVIWIKTPVETCIMQNENRKGTRGFIPLNAIRQMNASIEAPSFKEGFTKIYIVEPNKKIQVKERCTI